MRYVNELMKNVVLWTAIVSWAIAQLIKIAIELWRTKKFTPSLIMSSGGMPSSHTSFVSAMSTAAGILEGFDSIIFAVCAIVSFVVMYDAAGVRRAAGKQAEILNIMIANIENSGITLDKKLKELLGHTPIEVACGAILGVIVAFVSVG